MKWLLLLLCLASSASAQMVQSVVNTTTAAAGPGPLSLDGTAVNSGSTSPLTLSLTTTQGSGVIVVALLSNASSITSVTAPGLTFTSRKSIGPTAGPGIIAEFTAPYSATFSGTISINLGSNAYVAASAWGVANATTFDANASVPNTHTTSTACAVSTTTAADFIYGVAGSSTLSGATAGAGWTLISPATAFGFWEYQIVSSTQTALSLTITGATSQGCIEDALHS